MKEVRQLFKRYYKKLNAKTMPLKAADKKSKENEPRARLPAVGIRDGVRA
jgi:hypothetical protein